MKKISLIIPCYNEEDGIAEVIKGVPVKSLKKYGYLVDVIVIDNNSSDKTAQIAKELNARVLFEGRQGKGNAIRTAFNSISDDTDYVVMVDGDDTYKTHEIMRLIEPLNSGFCDVVVGSRLAGKASKEAFNFTNLLGNWVFTFLVRVIYKENVTDVLSGYFAWKKEVVDELKTHLDSTGFSIEMEIVTNMVKLDYEVFSVPITYAPRAGETKLNPVMDGLKILATLFQNIIWRPRSTKLLIGKSSISSR